MKGPEGFSFFFHKRVYKYKNIVDLLALSWPQEVSSHPDYNIVKLRVLFKTADLWSYIMPT